MFSDVNAGETVTLDGTNSTAAYGDGVAYDWTVNGETLTGETVSTAFDEPGEYTVSAGDRSATVTVPESTTTVGTDTETEPPIPDEQPGFGVIAAVFALLSFGLIPRKA